MILIKVCDCIMGAGKSTASINYMNRHPEERFIYITPYLEEADRIQAGCPALRFVTPSDKLSEYHFKKREHTAELLRLGRNIATTHQSFKRYTAEMLEDIRKFGYHLIIDENVDVLEEYGCHKDDIRMAVSAGYLSEHDDTYHLIDDSYRGSVMREMFKFFEVRDLVRVDGGERTYFYYWILPKDLLTAFKDVYILTYLFEGQSLYYFLEMNDLKYERIGINVDESGDYCFGDYPGLIPDYVHHLKDMINIIDSPKLNAVGDRRTALSMTWFDTNLEDVEQLRKNVDNCVRQIWADTPGSKKLWGTFKKQFSKMKGKGYTKSFLTFNAKATNNYRDRTCLIYIANIFMNVSMKMFYQKNGITVDEDKYALSVMVQWIWRSAIRQGEKINLYIPSSRMRNLLIDWIDSLSQGGDVVG